MSMLNSINFLISTAHAEKVMNEKCDGNRNLIHKAVSCCFPSSTMNKQATTSKPSDKDSIAQGDDLVRVFS